MKSILRLSLLCATALIAHISFAQVVDSNDFPPVRWVSKNSNDVVTIQNGSGSGLMIAITVDGSNTSKGPSLTVRNCGTTTNVQAGSSAICYTTDAKNPVNFNSSSGDTPMSGTYQIKHQ